MSSDFTISAILKSPCAPRNSHLINKKINKPKKLSKQKTWITFRLLKFCEERGLKLETEYLFSKTRRWKFDWATPEIKTAIEYEGVFSAKSRHTTVTGFTGDTEKYNQAQQLGWKVLRYTALNYLDLVIDLEKL